MLRTTVRDCLYLNWAFPAEALPPPPAPLRYQRHPWQGRDYVFASALLFHQDALHLTALPSLKFGYPQLNVRLYVLDDEGVPSALFRRMLMPGWVAPGVRLITHQPAARARLRFPHPSRNGGGPWRWSAERRGSLEVRAWMGSPAVGEGPRLGSWEDSVRYFQERPRGYALASDELQRISTADHPAVTTWPMRAEVEGDGLLPRLLDLSPGTCLPGLHSAWLCPEIPIVFELGFVLRVPAAPAALPHPAAGRVVSFFRGDDGERTPPERRRASC
jgi:uncharacterized protein DUF2071